MCDYSLCGLPNRLAVEGETLQAFRFPSGSMGLVSAHELHGESAAQARQMNLRLALKNFIRNLSRPGRRPMVVCVPPGAELIFRDIPPSLRQLHGVAAEECVRFTQTSFAVSAYRDAIQFRNGVTVGLQELPEGLRAEVLSLNGDFSDWRPPVSDSELRVSSSHRRHPRVGA